MPVIFLDIYEVGLFFIYCSENKEWDKFMETPILRTKKIGTLIEGTNYRCQNLAFLC